MLSIVIVPAVLSSVCVLQSTPQSDPRWRLCFVAFLFFSGLSNNPGMLLYGPPGTGKTLIARQIGKSLRAREPVIVNGPEILNKYVGQSEENIRNLFKAAEDEYRRVRPFLADQKAVCVPEWNALDTREIRCPALDDAKHIRAVYMLALPMVC